MQLDANADYIPQHQCYLLILVMFDLVGEIRSLTAALGQLTSCTMSLNVELTLMCLAFSSTFLIYFIPAAQTLFAHFKAFVFAYKEYKGY